MSEVPWFELCARRACVTYTTGRMRALFASEISKGYFELLGYFADTPTDEDLGLMGEIGAEIIAAFGERASFGAKCMHSYGPWSELKKLQHCLYVHSEWYEDAVMMDQS